MRGDSRAAAFLASLLALAAAPPQPRAVKPEPSNLDGGRFAVLAAHLLDLDGGRRVGPVMVVVAGEAIERVEVGAAAKPQDLHGAAEARATLEAGFTTVRNLGSTAEADLRLRDAIARGEVPGPRLLRRPGGRRRRPPRRSRPPRTPELRDEGWGGGEGRTVLATSNHHGGMNLSIVVYS